MDECIHCDRGWLIIYNEFTCAKCYGTGILNRNTCMRCKGSGIYKTRFRYSCPHCIRSRL